MSDPNGVQDPRTRDGEEVSEKPILFSGPMVRAILEGRKTQTRRIVKLPPAPNHLGHWEPVTFGGDGCTYYDSKMEPFEYPLTAGVFHTRSGETILSRIRSGDTLWVRETHVIQRDFEGEPPPFDDGRPIQRHEDGRWLQPHYRATDPEPELHYDDIEGPGCRWRPSIHMPRWACRLFLRVESVRVEQLQEITENDAVAEGTRAVSITDIRRQAVWTERQDFAQLWDEINGKRAPWESNPWVWVITFERIEP